MKIISDHGFPKGDGSLPTDDAFDRFKNEREYVAQSGRMKTTVAAMDWAAAEIEKLRTRLAPDRDGIAKLIDGEAWMAICDGRDAAPDSLWFIRRDWALRKADAILDLYALTPADGGGK